MFRRHRQTDGGIKKAAEKEEHIKSFNELYGRIINEFEQIKEGDKTTLSANLKHIYMQMVCEYAAYVKEVTGAQR